MSKLSSSSVLLTLMIAAMTLTGCEAIQGIFKAGMWVGIIAAVIVVALVVGLGRVFSRS